MRHVFQVLILFIVFIKEIPLNSIVLTMTLIQQYYFYATGHEPTFTNIRWEVVFHGLTGDSSNIFISIISTIFLLITTYSSYLFVSIYTIIIAKQLINKFYKDDDLKTKTELFVTIIEYVFYASLKVRT